VDITFQGTPQDSIRAVLDQVFAAGDFRWEEPPEVTNWLVSRFHELMRWLQDLEASYPVSYWIVMGVASVLLVVILIHFSYLIAKALRFRPETHAQAQTLLADVWDEQAHLREARRLSEAGKFAEALGHRFTALILRLDRRHALHFHPAKTPAEYVREARVDDSGRSLLNTLVTDLYKHIFGGSPCTSTQWLRFDQSAVEVERHVAA
jgi:hypothetical protein